MPVSKFRNEGVVKLTVLFVTVLLAWLLYEFIAQVVAEVKAKKMNEAYKKLRDIAEGRKPDDE